MHEDLPVRVQSQIDATSEIVEFQNGKILRQYIIDGPVVRRVENRCGESGGSIQASIKLDRGNSHIHRFFYGCGHSDGRACVKIQTVLKSSR